jgi:fatty acid desaturase
MKANLSVVEGVFQGRDRFALEGERLPLPDIDRAGFAAELGALRSQLIAEIGESDLRHLQRIAWLARTLALSGLLLAAAFWHPLTIALATLMLSAANVARWTMVAHHVMHRGYDRVPSVPACYHSKHFALGWRRFLDWLDWMHPKAWAHEHNYLHHMHTGEWDDPDLVEHHSWLLRRPWMPRPIKWLLIVMLMLTWKLIYYAPNTMLLWQQKRQGNSGIGHGQQSRLLYPGERLLLPHSKAGLEFYLRCVLPYLGLRFGVLPLLFLPFGEAAWLGVLVALVMAELLANLHSFLIIVPNHTGADVYRYLSPARARDDFYLRQLMGTVNYRSRNGLSDFLMGYLNYQIEHHLWPDLPMLKYRQAAPQVRALCQKYGVPYLEQSLWRRILQMWAIMEGQQSMKIAKPMEQ